MHKKGEKEEKESGKISSCTERNMSSHYKLKTKPGVYASVFGSAKSGLVGEVAPKVNVAGASAFCFVVSGLVGEDVPKENVAGASTFGCVVSGLVGEDAPKENVAGASAFGCVVSGLVGEVDSAFGCAVSGLVGEVVPKENVAGASAFGCVSFSSPLSLSSDLEVADASVLVGEALSFGVIRDFISDSSPMCIDDRGLDGFATRHTEQVSPSFSVSQQGQIHFSVLSLLTVSPAGVDPTVPKSPVVGLTSNILLAGAPRSGFTGVNPAGNNPVEGPPNNPVEGPPNNPDGGGSPNKLPFAAVV